MNSAARTTLRWLLQPGYLLPLVAGVVFPLAFAPFAWRWVALLSLIALFHSWSNSSPRLAALQGLIFGLGAFGVGTHWIYYSLKLFGDAIAPLAALVTVGFVIYFSLNTKQIDQINIYASAHF